MESVILSKETINVVKVVLKDKNKYQSPDNIEVFLNGHKLSGVLRISNTISGKESYPVVSLDFCSDYVIE